MPEVQTTSEEDLARRFSSSQAWQPNLSFVQAAKFELEHRQKPGKLASRPPLVQASGESGRRCCRNLSSYHLLSLEIFCTGVSFTYFLKILCDWFFGMFDYWYVHLIQVVIFVRLKVTVVHTVCLSAYWYLVNNDYICMSNFSGSDSFSYFLKGIKDICRVSFPLRWVWDKKVDHFCDSKCNILSVQASFVQDLNYLLLLALLSFVGNIVQFIVHSI